MIGKVTKGYSFKGLGAYLASGSTGLEWDRVAWAEGRNLGTDDPEIAAKVMAATAMQSRRVDKPVWHLSVSWPEGDKVDKEAMQLAADQTLKDLGLDEHQVMIVAHNDTKQQHIHFMVNRVHPEKGTAWENWWDYAKVEKTLRQQEIERGLQVVPGRHAEVPGFEHEKPERNPTNGDYQKAKRQGEVVLAPWDKQTVKAMRENLGDTFKQARSWRELEQRLGEKGVGLQPKGQGLILTDGKGFTKLSALGKKVSLKRFEEQFGQSYRDHQKAVEKRAVPDKKAKGGLKKGQSLSIAVEAYMALQEFKRLEQSTGASGKNFRDIRREKGRADFAKLRNAERIQGLEDQFYKALLTAYKDPEKALTLWNKDQVSGHLKKGRLYGELHGVKATKMRKEAYKAANALYGLHNRLDKARGKQTDWNNRLFALETEASIREKEYTENKERLGSPEEKKKTRLKLHIEQAKALRNINELDIFESTLPDEIKYRLYVEWNKQAEKDQERSFNKEAMQKASERIAEPPKPKDEKPFSWSSLIPTEHKNDPVMQLHFADQAVKNFENIRIKTREAWTKYDTAKKRLDLLNKRGGVSEFKRQAFIRQLAKVYKDAQKASKEWDRIEQQIGFGQFMDQYAKEPEKLGELIGWQKMLLESAERKDARKAFEEAIQKRREWIEALQDKQVLEKEIEETKLMVVHLEAEHQSLREQIGKDTKEENSRKKELEKDRKEALSKVTPEQIKESKSLAEKQKRYLENLLNIQRQREKRERERGKGRER